MVEEEGGIRTDRIFTPFAQTWCNWIMRIARKLAKDLEFRARSHSCFSACEAARSLVIEEETVFD